jgi:hypothetical protein
VTNHGDKTRDGVKVKDFDYVYKPRRNGTVEQCLVRNGRACSEDWGVYYPLATCYSTAAAATKARRRDGKFKSLLVTTHVKAAENATSLKRTKQ